MQLAAATLANTHSVGFLSTTIRLFGIVRSMGCRLSHHRCSSIGLQILIRCCWRFRPEPQSAPRDRQFSAGAGVLSCRSPRLKRPPVAELVSMPCSLFRSKNYRGVILCRLTPGYLGQGLRLCLCHRRRRVNQFRTLPPDLGAETEELVLLERSEPSLLISGAKSPATWGC